MKTRSSSDERVLCTIAETFERLHAEITRVHPAEDCLPIPEMAIRAAHQLRPVVTALSDNLFTANGGRSDPWKHARRACEHVSDAEITRLYELIYHYRGVLIAAEHLDKPAARRLYDFDTEVWRFHLWLASPYGLIES